MDYRWSMVKVLSSAVMGGQWRKLAASGFCEFTSIKTWPGLIIITEAAKQKLFFLHRLKRLHMAFRTLCGFCTCTMEMSYRLNHGNKKSGQNISSTEVLQVQRWRKRTCETKTDTHLLSLSHLLPLAYVKKSSILSSSLWFDQNKILLKYQGPFLLSAGAFSPSQLFLETSQLVSWTALYLKLPHVSSSSSNKLQKKWMFA